MRFSIKKRILIIENDSFIQQLLIDLLKRYGYSAEGAASGSEALRKINQSNFDGIFLDIHLDDMEGKAVYQKV